MSDAAFDTPSVGDIAVAQHDANIIYVGTGSDGLRSNVIDGKGVYKSIDGETLDPSRGSRKPGISGPRWKSIHAIRTPSGSQRSVRRTAPTRSAGSIARGTGARTGTRCSSCPRQVGFADVELVPGNRMWSTRPPGVPPHALDHCQRRPCGSGGIYKSVDGGDHWEKLSSGLPEGLIGKIDLAVTPADSSIVYALIEAPGDEGGLYKSVNEGRDFVQISAESSIRTRPFYYANIDVDPTDPDVLYAMATRNMKSVDEAVAGRAVRRTETATTCGSIQMIHSTSCRRMMAARTSLSMAVRPGRPSSISPPPSSIRSKWTISTPTGSMPASKTTAPPLPCRACRPFVPRTNRRNRRRRWLRDRPRGPEAGQREHRLRQLQGPLLGLRQAPRHRTQPLHRCGKHLRPQSRRPALPLPAGRAHPRVTARSRRRLHGVTVRAPDPR